jgi:hypothetical protein
MWFDPRFRGEVVNFTEDNVPVGEVEGKEESKRDVEEEFTEG